MAKLPALQFYPGDWKKDMGVQSLSFHDRAVWFEMLLLMHESEERGRLVLNGRAMPTPILARILGIEISTLESALKAILDYGVAGEDEGVIFCRRMVRDEEKRTSQSSAGKLGGNPALCGGYNKPGFLYAVQRSSDGSVKIGISDNPTRRLYKLRYLAKGDRLELLAFKHVADMGFAEKEQHLKYAHRASGEWFSLNPAELSLLVSTLKGNDKEDVTPSSSSSSSTTEPKNGVDGGKPEVDVSGLVRKCVCAHPKSLQRSLKPNEVSQRDETAVLEAMASEISASGCTGPDALQMILSRTQMLADKVPRAQWRYFKDASEFFRNHWYRLEPEEIASREPGNGTGKQHNRGAAVGRVNRSGAGFGAVTERRVAQATGTDAAATVSSVPASGSGAGNSGDIFRDVREPGDSARNEESRDGPAVVPDAPEILPPSQRSVRGT